MIPESLRILGLYSYQTSQSIDFKRLTDDRMFGIFGNVGSGKSSILEAITLALYNQIERISSKEGRNYNLMNLRSKKLEIDFAFRVGERKFRIEVRAKRNTKDFENVPPFSNKKFEWKDGDWVLLNEPIESLLGLSYDNFKRTIIIPQGKFLDFLQLPPRDRTQMLQELFNLEQFDLSGKVNLQSKQISLKLGHLRGQILELGEIKIEDLERLEKERKDLETKILLVQRNLDKIQTEKKESELIKTSLEKIQAWEDEFSVLKKQEGAIAELKKQWADYRFCKDKFSILLYDYDTSNEDYFKWKESYNQSEIEFKHLKEQETKVFEIFEKSKINYDQKEELKKKSEEWSKYRDWTQYNSQKNLQVKRREALETELSEIKAKWNQFKKEETEILESIQVLKTKLEEEEKWTESLLYLSDKHNIRKRYQELEDRMNQLILQKNKRYTEFSQSIKDVYGESISFSESLDWLRKKEQELLTLEKENEETRFFEKFSEYSQTLKIGDTCPLCGGEIHSIDHIHKKNREISGKTNGNIFQDQKQKFKSLEMKRISLQDFVDSTESEIISLSAQMENLKEKLPTESETREFFGIGKKMEQVKEIKKEIKIKEELIVQKTKNSQAIDKKTSDLEKEIQSILLNLSGLDGKMEAIWKEIRDEIRVKGESLSLEDIDNRLEKQRDRLDNIEKDFLNSEKQWKDFQSQKDKMYTIVQERATNLTESKKRLDQSEESLKAKLEEHTQYSLERIRQVLGQKHLGDDTESRIEKYEISVSRLQTLLDQEREKLGNQDWSLESYQKILAEESNITQELGQCKEKLGSLKQSIERFVANLERRKILDTEIQVLEDKLARVDVLKKLFEGKGFVNYVSRLFLEDLCESANERFFVFTRNKLRLELNDKNEIQVRDLFHDGRYRHIKTLSGGQLFQASLAMALALSDRIQNSAGVTERFFFLDEGFGSLDKESLGIVFETLKSLRKENRIVGLISHVEEMKAEIRTYLSVTNDPEKGTELKGSWAR